MLFSLSALLLCDAGARELEIIKSENLEVCIMGSYLVVSLDRNKSLCWRPFLSCSFFFLNHIMVAGVVNKIFIPVCLMSQPLLSTHLDLSEKFNL